MDHITDAELVAKVREGDKEAFGQLVERYQQMMERIEKAAPQTQVELLTEFREIDRDVVLNEHKEQKENLLQFLASLTRSNLESELQRDKEEREQTKQELIASWKEERKQNQQVT